MPDQRLKYLFDRFVEGSCSPAEKTELSALALTPVHEQDLQEILDQYWLIVQAERSMPEERSDAILRAVSAKEFDGSPRVHRVHFLRFRWWAAAVLLAMAFGAWFFMVRPDLANLSSDSETATNQKADITAPANNKAIITLPNGRVITLDSLQNGLLADQGGVELIKTADGQVAYRQSGSSASNIGPIYNTLTNPRGSKVIDLGLADGSHVWLNAGSSITYPILFNGKERNVSITGEAYFEVAHQAKTPFIVSKGNMKVSVLGTHFNVNCYDDEPSLKVTLLEGSVKVNNTIIKPGQQAVVEGDVTVLNNVDLEAVMAWKNGKFEFSGLSVDQIMRQISRWYDVEVVYEGKVPDYEFVGGTPRQDNLSGTLKVLEATNKIHFRVEGKKVIVSN